MTSGTDVYNLEGDEGLEVIVSIEAAIDEISIAPEIVHKQNDINRIVVVSHRGVMNVTIDHPAYTEIYNLTEKDNLVSIIDIDEAVNKMIY